LLIDKDVITWSDNRYSNGNIYKQNGFEFDGNLKPDYVYFDRNKHTILSKQSQQKSKNGYPDNMTEKEYCESIGLLRLWDCGKIRWIHTKDVK